jgi:hypothetical protein
LTWWISPLADLFSGLIDTQQSHADPALSINMAPSRATIHWMAIGDVQQQRMLERLRAAAGEPVTFAELRASGVDFPAAVVSELELSGYVVDRVHANGRLVGVRLVEPEAPDRPTTGRRRRLVRRHR